MLVSDDLYVVWTHALALCDDTNNLTQINKLEVQAMTNGVSSEVACKQEKGEETCENIMEESEQENGEDIFSDIAQDKSKKKC